MSGPIIRVRDLPYSYGGDTVYRYDSGVTIPVKGTIKLDGRQKTISQGTTFSRKAFKEYNKKYDAGSEFFTAKSETFGGVLRPYFRVGPGFLAIYNGLTHSHVQTRPPLLLPLSVSQESALRAAGTTAIARCLPTNPVAGLANFLGELKRDGLPSAPGASMQSAFKERTLRKNVGHEYLNYEFALKPFYSDLRDFANVVKDHNKILKQYERDSGKGIRRRYQFPWTQTTTRSTLSNVLPGASGAADMFTPGTLETIVDTRVDRWFSGEFTYYLKLMDDMWAKMDRFESEANKLLGTRLSPELVWNLTPWSWAADWFTNAGDVFHNVSAFQADGLVMRYGYIMETTTVTTTTTLSGFGLKPGVTGDTSPITTVRVQQRKVRRRASPFGFGLTNADLTPRQLAIIAALGLTRETSRAK